MTTTAIRFPTFTVDLAEANKLCHRLGEALRWAGLEPYGDEIRDQMILIRAIPGRWITVEFNAVRDRLPVLIYVTEEAVERLIHILDSWTEERDVDVRLTEAEAAQLWAMLVVAVGKPFACWQQRKMSQCPCYVCRTTWAAFGPGGPQRWPEQVSVVRPAGRMSVAVAR